MNSHDTGSRDVSSQGMSSHDIRRSFLAFFEEKGHTVLPSSPVVPHGDPTLLFTNAGMNQFKDIFTGKARAEAPRVATVQKCIRAGGKHNDLDNVGYTARHLTFFEMLGNFSFGDYFKLEAIRFAWEYLTERVGLDPGRLWATVYRDDDEAERIWREEIGVPAERVLRLGEKDNYWTMGDVGPCGPCSEILLDRGERYSCGPDCGIGSCECDRYFEIWNLVFMQFDQDGTGEKVPLEKPSIDTGMGLERLAMVLQGADSVFETDVLRSIIGRIEELTGVPYAGGERGIPHRVIADHVRCLVFAFADGAEPSNEGRGYVLRRILRRAARYGRNLKASEKPLLHGLVGTVLDLMGDAYPEIRQRQKYIEGVIRSEEERFGRTLDQGLERYREVVDRLRRDGSTTIPGEDVFLLYDTFGFPVDLVEQMAAESGLEVDQEGFEEAMRRQRERSRATSAFSVRAGGDEDALDVARYPETRFVGYAESTCDAEILGASRREDEWRVILSGSPFYAESGGQVGDTGRLAAGDFVLEVTDTKKEAGRWIHLARLVEGNPDRVRPGEVVTAAIDVARRAAIERNHTATHLLHAALRRVLGEHVHQKGSLVDAPRLRFDVTHFNAITPEERERVEAIVLEEIARNTPVETFETDYDEAVRGGAMALFGEKYGQVVRVVRIGDFSMELCGGTHVERTGDIGEFVIAQEGSVSAGVRRLEALSAARAAELHRRNARIVDALSARLRAPPDAILERIEKLEKELRDLRSGRARHKKTGPAPSLDDLGVTTERIEGAGAGGEILVSTALLDDADMKDALALHDRLRSRHDRGVTIVVSRRDGKAQAVVGLGKALAEAGWDAREIFAAGAEVLGARGGGRPDLVRGGGTRPEAAAAALAAMRQAALDRARG